MSQLTQAVAAISAVGVGILAFREFVGGGGDGGSAPPLSQRVTPSYGTVDPDTGEPSGPGNGVNLNLGFRSPEQDQPMQTSSGTTTGPQQQDNDAASTGSETPEQDTEPSGPGDGVNLSVGFSGGSNDDSDSVDSGESGVDLSTGFSGSGSGSSDSSDGSSGSTDDGESGVDLSTGFGGGGDDENDDASTGTELSTGFKSTPRGGGL